MDEQLQTVLERARASQPSAGGTRVLAIDGRSGSGKTTIAERISRDGGAPMVGMEQLYGGWGGLRDGIERLCHEVLQPLARGEQVRVPLYDWHARAWRRGELLHAPGLLIVEGVGAGSLMAAPYTSLLAWVELDDPSRRTRALARDGELYEGHWDQWSEQEQAYLLSDRPERRADVTIRP